MAGAYSLIFGGLFGLAVGAYLLMGEGVVGLVFFAMGWILIILGIRQAVSNKSDQKENGDAG